MRHSADDPATSLAIRKLGVADRAAKEDLRLPHHTPLIATIVGGLVLAFIFGALANRLRMPPLAGYLIAGILVGPYTPGFVADSGLALDLAEIGVILLMFGVGLHFSVKDLLSVKAIAIPGAIVQMAVATVLGMALAWLMGWPVAEGFVFGLALSVASTVVLLKALQERRLVETTRGRIAVGWLIVEDLAMVLALVLLPALAGLIGTNGAGDAAPVAASADGALLAIVITLAKVATFIALMLIFGHRVIPWILHRVAGTGDRELFRLAVLAVALGVAFGSAMLFDVSFALGAFFAGMVLSESELSHRAAEETLPLRDAFAVLFFVSVGMIFNPGIMLVAPWAVIGALLIIVFGKSIAALSIVLAFRHPLSTALTISASLAQIGEFSFILATLGVGLGILSETGRDIILAAAILSILVNPIIFMLLDRLGPWLEERERSKKGEVPAKALPVSALTEHTVLIGYGRVGSLIGEALRANGRPFLVVEEQPDLIDTLRSRGIEVIAGNAAKGDVLTRSNIAHANALVIAVPNCFEAGQAVHKARAANPDVEIIARAHSDAEVEHLRKQGADFVVMGEREIAQSMAERLDIDEDLPEPAFEAARKGSNRPAPAH
jgi:CPA2 family monovalent cation:H+ antiporter-2